jgi:hypothetical protein
VIDGPEEWLGTQISFDLKQNREWTIVLFKHQGWREPVEFMHHCSTKWAVFLLSLKSLLETGEGTPWPNETKVDISEHPTGATVSAARVAPATTGRAM